MSLRLRRIGQDGVRRGRNAWGPRRGMQPRAVTKTRRGASEHDHYITRVNENLLPGLVPSPPCTGAIPRAPPRVVARPSF